MTHSSTLNYDSEPVQPKAMLYCWDCAHENPPDGDWARRTQGNVVAYDCPTCGTTIAKRPQSDETDSDSHRPQTAWGRMMHNSIDAWRASVDASLTALLR